MADDLFCPEHVNTELVAAEDTGEPTCWVCTSIRVAGLADSFGIIDADGQDREVSKAEFIERVLAGA